MVGQIPVRSWLEATKHLGMALGLTNTANAVEALCLPTSSLTTVHVAGSNGKGTACAMLCTALSNQGISNLLFSSPHLVRIEERIRINGVPIQSDVMDRALERVRLATLEHDITVTFFEVTFLAALVVASEAEVEVLVLETGLGGRLDATRVSNADVCMLTSISLEHTDILGTHQTDIAREKAAIARAGRPLIVRTPEHKDVLETIIECARNAGMVHLEESIGPAELVLVDIPTGTSFRDESKLLVNAIWPYLDVVNAQLEPDTSNCVWPARMQFIKSQQPSKPHVLLDGAHNPSGLKRAVQELCLRPEIQSGNWVLLFGTSPQVDLEDTLSYVLNLCTSNPPVEIILSEPQGGRYPAVPVAELKPWFSPLGTHLSTHSNPRSAVEHAQDAYDQSTLLVSIGSLYMQGNVLTSLGIDSNDDLSFVAKN
jgi:dihydrofolate synthase/folylpolyglutamate synthase